MVANTVARDRRHTHTQALLPSCRNKSTSANPRCTRTHRHIKYIGNENIAQTHFTTMDIDTDIDAVTHGTAAEAVRQWAVGGTDEDP